MQSKRIKLVRPPRVSTLLADGLVDSAAERDNSAQTSIDSLTKSGGNCASSTTGEYLVVKRRSCVDTIPRLQTAHEKIDVENSGTSVQLVNASSIDIYEKPIGVQVNSIEVALQSFVLKKLQLIEEERKDCQYKSTTNHNLHVEKTEYHSAGDLVLHRKKSVQDVSHCSTSTIVSGVDVRLYDHATDPTEEKRVVRKSQFGAVLNVFRGNGLSKLCAQHETDYDQNKYHRRGNLETEERCDAIEGWVKLNRNSGVYTKKLKAESNRKIDSKISSFVEESFLQPSWMKLDRLLSIGEKLQSGSRSKSQTEKSLLEPSWMKFDQRFNPDKKKFKSKNKSRTDNLSHVDKSLLRPSLMKDDNLSGSETGQNRTESRSKSRQENEGSSCAIESLLHQGMKVYQRRKKNSTSNEESYGAHKSKKHKSKHSSNDSDYRKHKHKCKKSKRGSKVTQSAASDHKIEKKVSVSSTGSETKRIDSQCSPSIKLTQAVCKSSEKSFDAVGRSPSPEGFIPRKVNLDDDEDDIVKKLSKNKTKKLNGIAFPVESKAYILKQRQSLSKLNSVVLRSSIADAGKNIINDSEIDCRADDSESGIEKYTQVFVARGNDNFGEMKQRDMLSLSCQNCDEISLRNEEAEELIVSCVSGINVVNETANTLRGKVARLSCSVTKDAMDSSSEDGVLMRKSSSLSCESCTETQSKIINVTVDGLRIKLHGDEPVFKIPSSFSQTAVKKPVALRLGLKISHNSAAIISSGFKQTAAQKNLEEGELSDSDEEDSVSNSADDIQPFEGGLVTGLSQSSTSVDELDTSGSLTDSDDDAVRQSSPTDVKVSPKRICGNSKKSKKRKKSHKRGKSDTDKRIKSKSCTSKQSKVRSPSRSRARSFSVMRTFDTKRGVWRLRKRSEIKARQMAAQQLRPLNELRLQIDKQRLREIAVKNAYQHMKAGTGPAVRLKATELSRITQGGKTIAELTELCKSMIRSNSYDSDNKSSDDEDARRRQRSSFRDDDNGNVLICSQLRPAKDSNIKISIRNARQLPILSKEEKLAQANALRLDFPVSSGMHHRSKEWQPVEMEVIGADKSSAGSSKKKAEEKMETTVKEITVGVNVRNIGQIVSERLNALRQLSNNPNNVDAMNAAYQTEQQNAPTTKAGPAVVASSNAGSSCTTVGHLLLQKMGWKEGEGLGKNSNGPLAPLEVDMKTDRKGLDWVEPRLLPPPRPTPVAEPPSVPSTFNDLTNLHPISALVEICVRKRWMQPVYELIEDSGLPHRKSFRFKVIVDGVDYQPACSSRNKKIARAEAAVACLQQLANSPIFRKSCPAASTPLCLHTDVSSVRDARASSPESSPVIRPQLEKPSAQIRQPTFTGFFPQTPQFMVPSLLRTPFDSSDMVSNKLIHATNPQIDFTDDSIIFSTITPDFTSGDCAFGMENEYDEDADEDPFEEEQFEFHPNELPAELFRPRSFVEGSDCAHESEDYQEIYEEPFPGSFEHDDSVLPEWEPYPLVAATQPRGFGVQQAFTFADFHSRAVHTGYDQFMVGINSSPHSVNYEPRLFGRRMGLIRLRPPFLRGRGVQFGSPSPVRVQNVEQFVRHQTAIRQPVRSLMSIPARPVVLQRLSFPRNLY